MTQQLHYGYLPQRYRCSEKKGQMHPNVHSSNVRNSQTVEGAEMPFNRWTDKDVVHVYNVYSNVIYNSQIMETAQVPIDWSMDKDNIYTP